MDTLSAPPNASLVQQVIRERQEEALKLKGEKITVDWRDSTIHLEVITVPLDLLLYNPETHRIRAQKSIDSVKSSRLAESPWGDEAQLYLGKLLKCLPSNPDLVDPEFDQLRDDLENFGQKDPGLITSDGILVNGNTRCAALRELGETNIRVGVLPQSANWDDINAVELSLQLRKEYKRDYSYINRLIAVEDLLEKGRRLEDVARHFHIQQKTLQNDRWIYNLLEEAITRSKLDSGESLSFADFEDHQEKLRELQRAYSKLQGTNREMAELLKETRLTLIILGFSKTDLRFAQPDFKEKYLDTKLPDSLRNDKSEKLANQPAEIPGLSGLTIPGESEKIARHKQFTDKLLRARATLKLDPLKNKDEVSGSEQILKTAIDAAERAMEPAGRDDRLRKRKLAAPERLSDAIDDIDLCTQEIVESRAKQALDIAAIEDACMTLRDSLTNLAKQLRISATNPDEGVQWILDVTRNV